MKVIVFGFWWLMMVGCVIGLIVCVIGIIRNGVVYKNQMIILDAIRRYNLEKISKCSCNNTISYSLMEDYNDTFKRIFDWGYENILPPGQFELIKPYIETGKKKEKNS